MSNLELPTIAAATDVMQCMEVWGGSQPIDSRIAMWGLDAWVYSKPFGGAAAGGDVYYVSSCATGRITRLLVADVSGHGAASEEPARALRDLMRRYVNYLDQGRFVEEMNQKFTALSESGCFATAIVTTFFATNGHLSICNAGHPPPLVYRAAAGRWDLLVDPEDDGSVHDLPLGIEESVGYRHYELDLRAGDMLVCYTDSLIEARQADGELIGLEGLLRVVRGLGVTAPSELIPRLLAAVVAGSDASASDDLTILIFQANGNGRRIPLRVRWLAPLRVARGVALALLRGQKMPRPELSLANLGGAFITRLGHRWRGKT